ncbi:MAG: hypothetical protein JSU87_08870 [Gemmatimonadota bacterium]|nr:MAG: hypothetical protein JSU87_08870 [Gemmatimonadota bacterium]
MAAYDEIAKADYWPGFAPESIPLAVYDGDNTYLLRHPSPPEGFTAVGDRQGLWVFTGQHELVRANFSVEIGGVLTAALLAGSDTAAAPRTLAATLIHEAFHVYQRREHPDWQANEVELFTYPVEDVDLLAFRRLETEALRRALKAPDVGERACWARRAVELREERYVRTTEGAVAYERGTELTEGTARYVQSRVSDTEPELLTDRGFGAEEVRARAYAVGSAIAILLDDMAPDWKAALERGAASSLDGLLAGAAAEHDGSDCQFTADELTTARSQAGADVAALVADLQALRREFMTAPGHRLVIEAEGDAVLWPEAFDPSNLKRLTSMEILHTRWLKLSNSDSRLEVLDASALSEGVGPHPIFNGVRRVTLTGLEGEPVVSDSAGALLVEALGLRGMFRAAEIERSGTTINIRLGPS